MPNPVNSIWIASASAGAGKMVAPVTRFLKTQLTAVTWVWAAFRVTVGSIATNASRSVGRSP